MSTNGSGQRGALRLAGAALTVLVLFLARIENQEPVKAVVAGWMDSPPHRVNILTRQYTRTGVGACRGETAVKAGHAAAPVYFTQVFLRER